MISTRTKTSICNLALDALRDLPLTDVETDNSPESRWFLRNYDEWLEAELREHVWKFAVRNRRLYPTDFVLRGGWQSAGDTRYGYLDGAWGFMRMIEEWSGNIVTIRRSSDDTTQTIGFDDEDGVLLDEDALSTFLGSATGYVTTLIDQSGNGYNIAQATAAKQPLFESEEEESGRPAASFDGTDDYLVSSTNASNLLTQSTSFIVVAGLVDATTLDRLIAGDAAQKIGLYTRDDCKLMALNDDGSADIVFDAVPLLQPFVATLRHEDGTLYVSVNGRPEKSKASGTTSTLANLFNVGGDATGTYALDFHLYALATYQVPPDPEECKRIVERLMRWCKVRGVGQTAWQYRYPAPADCLRMLPLREGGAFEGNLIPHEIEDRDILTNRSGYVDARYIAAITDPLRFDPLFVKAFAGRLAMQMAHGLTGKQGMVQTAAAFYAAAISAARKANAIEGSPERPAGNQVIDARGPLGYWPRNRSMVRL